MAERSTLPHHHPFELSRTRTRQASTSSSEQSSATDDKSTSPNPRQPRVSPALGVHHPSATNPREPPRHRVAKQTSAGTRGGSAKGSSTSMTAPLDPTGEVTYTPTTHRISKAKKGKKVHVCEHPGCNKVFTRAEHRKRHEANHNAKPMFECQFEDCRKPFNRADLLARHMERQHEILGGATRAPGSQRSTSETSSNPPTGRMVPPTMGQPQPVSTQNLSHGPGAMAITSIIEHPMHNDLSHSTQGIGGLGQTGIGPMPMDYRSEWIYGPLGAGDSPMYSSDCSSPMSDYPTAQMPYQTLQPHEGIQRPPSTFSDSSFHQRTVASPLSGGSNFPPAWGTSDPASAYDGAYVPTTQEPALQLPFTNVPSQQWLPIRKQSTSPANVVMGRSGLLKTNNPRTRHYLECYWQYFHPLFPIVQFRFFTSTVPQSLLAASMVVIGAQFSPRRDAKQDSASLHAICQKLMSDRGPINSRSSVSDLQMAIHLEMFTRYRARSAKIEHMHGSPHFKPLYASLVADRDLLQSNYAALRQTLSAMTTAAQLQNAYRRWLDLETRCRLLDAAFVMDTHHNYLLQQTPPSSDILGEEDLDLPLPNPTETWDCPDLSTWHDLIMSQQNFSLSSLEMDPIPLDPFQSSLRTCYQIQFLQHSKNPIPSDLSYYPSKTNFLATILTHHALSVSKYTPLHALIITASESWLFGTKITDRTDWQQAKTTLRRWADNDSAMKAVWHATQLLKLAFHNQNQPPQQTDGVCYLHDLWGLYTAALVCWAFGFGTGANVTVLPQWMPDNAESLAWEYLGAMDVGNWWELSGVTTAARRNTRGLLECVRVKIGDVGLGGLLDGAEDVLFRLVDGESEMVKF
ncbi:MAG: hypothetical protein Q9170_004411 [Blastenia crenularia]